MAADADFEEGCRLYGTGRFSEAETIFRRCLELFPTNPDLLNALGSSIDARGSSEEAIPYLQLASRLRPDSAPFHHNLANVFRRVNNREEAENEYLEALRFDPQMVEALHGLGSMYLEDDKLDPAEACLQRALLNSPRFVLALHDLGQLHQRRGNRKEAENSYRSCIDSDATFVPALNSLGMLLLRQNIVDESRKCFEQAIAVDPFYLQARCNLAVAATWCGELDFAIRELREATRTAPNEGDLHFNLSLALLAAGMYDEGWQEHEWRFHKANPVPLRHTGIPRWQGEPLTGKRILIHAEQGYGDSLQFIRYAPLLANQGALVYVEGQDRIISPLLATVHGVLGAYSRGDALPAVDLQISMMSLPLVLGNISWPPPAEQYLNPPESLKLYWRKRLSLHSGQKIGLAWAGRPEHENDSNRSISEQDLAPFGKPRGVSFISLQFGARKAHELPFTITDYCSEIDGFSESAALVSQLDLVITVDSAVAHLAGALGIPVFLLLPWNPDWRWGHKLSESPWYPAMTIFRQSVPGSWKNAIAEVANILPS